MSHDIGKKTWKSRGWTPAYERKLLELYPITEYWGYLLEEFPGFTKRAIQSKARNLGLSKPRAAPIKVDRDEYVFSKWDERSAYLLGYLEADGCFVNKHPRSLSVIFASSSKDRVFMDKLKRFGRI